MFNNIIDSYGSLLDLVFVSNNQLLVNSVLLSVMPEDRYHPALSVGFTSQITVPKICSSLSYFDFRKADYNSTNNFVLSFNWANTISQLDTNFIVQRQHYLTHCIRQFYAMCRVLIVHHLTFRFGVLKN